MFLRDLGPDCLASLGPREVDFSGGQVWGSPPTHPKTIFESLIDQVFPKVREED